MVLAMGSVLPLQGAVAEDDTIVELRLWNIPGKNATMANEVARRRVFDAFCRAHPEIRARALVPLRIEGPAAEGNEFLAVAGGVAPDVFQLFGRKIGDYRTQGFLLPLNDYLADYARRRKMPYRGVAAPDAVWELCHNRGQVDVVPSDYYSMALVCDEAAFARRGLAGRYPRDWDELYEFARHLTVDPAKEPNGNPNDPVTYGINLLTGIYAGWHYLQYVWSAGGEVVQPYYPKDGKLEKVPVPPTDYRTLHIQLSNETDYHARVARQRAELTARGLPTDYAMSDLKWRLETDQPDALEALALYRKLAHQPWLRNGDHEFDLTPAMFASRKAVDPVNGDAFDLNDPAVKKRIYWGVAAAADIQSTGVQFGKWNDAMRIGTIQDFSSGTFVPFPSRKGFPPAAFIAGGYLGINAALAAEDRPGRRDVKAIRAAAWSYIEFVTGPEAQRITVDTFVEYGQTEFIRPSLLVSAGYADLLDRVPLERRKLWENVTTHAKVEPYCQGFTHVMTRELGMALEAVLSDRPDPQTGVCKRDVQGVMATVVRNVNTMILDRMPEPVVRKRARIGWVIFAVMAGALAFGIRMIVKLAMRAQSRWDDTEGFGVGGNPAARRLAAWVFLIPAIGTIAVWEYYPLARGLLMGFQDFRILGGSSFVGLRNFVEAVSEPKFWRYLLQTAQYMGMAVGIGFGVPILLAILLTEIPRCKVIYRTIYYLPAVTTGLVSLFLWKRLLYNPSSSGVLNRMILWFNTLPAWLAGALKIGVFVAVAAAAAGLFIQSTKDYYSRRGRWLAGLLGAVLTALLCAGLALLYRDGGVANMLAAFTRPFAFKVQSFLRDPGLAMLWVIVPGVWAGAGPGCLIYLAALKGIPEEQYEAADLDGAGLVQKAAHVTFPNLKALVIINFVGAVVGGFKASGNIFVMTGGGPEDATMTTGLYIWYNAFMFLNFGLSTAMAWIMGALLIGFTLTQLRILNKLQFRNVAADQQAAGGRA
jgi:ABC-type sugar transport system permease subunit